MQDPEPGETSARVVNVRRKRVELVLMEKLGNESMR